MKVVNGRVGEKEWARLENMIMGQTNDGNEASHLFSQSLDSWQGLGKDSDYATLPNT